MSANPIILRIEVEGSRGNKYVVSQRAKGNWACSCPGWKFQSPRRDCKHIRNIKVLDEKLKKEREKHPEFAFMNE